MTKRNGKQQTPLRIAGYIRVSALMGREGDDFHSPEVQREKIEAWATYRGAEVVRWYVDLDVSGTGKVRRPEFERMMADAREHRFDAVAVYKLTRFARSVQNAATDYRELRELGISLVSVTEDIDTTTASGQFMQNMLFAMAEFESDRIGEEWRNVHARRRQRGIAHVARGLYGFTVERAAIVGHHPERAEAVRLAYRLRRDGASYSVIRDALARQGFRPLGGGSRFAMSSLRDMLTNPLYCGLMRTPEGELVEACHEGLVTVDEWRAVQAMHTPANQAAPFRAALLSGLMICGSCREKMIYNSTGPKGGDPIYRCGSRTGTERCRAPVTIKARPAESYVEYLFLSRFDEARMSNGGKVRPTRKVDDWKKRAARLRGRADELTRALDRLADRRYVKGTLNAAEHERHEARYLTERAEVLEQAEELEAMAQTVRPLDVSVLSMWPDAPLDAKQRGLRLLIDHIDVRRSAVRGGSHDRGIDFEQRLAIAWWR